jgi:peptidoglycan-N-acetylglucosamine deacetylase
MGLVLWLSFKPQNQLNSNPLVVMRIFTPPAIFRALSHASVVWRVNTTEKKLYLTFDDGPCSSTTNNILEVLNDFGARATFFCLGSNVEKHESLYERILINHHAVGNHTYSHLNAWKVWPYTFWDDVEKCTPLISGNLFRPPYGNIPFIGLNERKQSLKTVMWTHMSYDFDKNISSAQIVKMLTGRAKKGDIIVFHDNEWAKERCLKALPVLINDFMKQGYVFDALNV